MLFYGYLVDNQLGCARAQVGAMSSRAQGRAVLLVLRNRKFRVGPDTSPHPFRRRRNACWDTEVVVREELCAHVKVVLGRVVFGDIVGVVFGAGRPENYEGLG